MVEEGPTTYEPNSCAKTPLFPLISRLFQLRVWALSQEGEDFVGDDTGLPEGLSWDIINPDKQVDTIFDVVTKIKEAKTRYGGGE